MGKRDMMDFDNVVDVTIELLSKQFPKECSCGETYVSLKDYILNTTPCGQPISYDAEEEDWTTNNPLGTLALSNCKCRTTLALSSKDVDLGIMHRLLDWVKTETKEKEISSRDLLDILRTAINQKVLEKSDEH